MAVGRAIDYYGGWTMTLSSLWKRHGIDIVIRYVGQPHNSKCITARELHGLRDNDISLCWVYETTATWMLGGRSAGQRAATAALSHIQSIGGPSDAIVYYAADWDVQETDLAACYACLDGAARETPSAQVGVYGGYRLVHGALDEGYAAWAWQAAAWQYGHIDPRCALLQHVGETWGPLGVNYDGDDVRKTDVGQWPSPSAGGIPNPAPAPSPTPPQPQGEPPWAWHAKVTNSGQTLTATYVPVQQSLRALRGLMS
jgi:hypothetical protein